MFSKNIDKQVMLKSFFLIFAYNLLDVQVMFAYTEYQELHDV